MTLPLANAQDSSLHDNFRTRFEVVSATTDALKDEAFRIRHNVYCEDLKYEPLRSDGRETDKFDSQSLHLLVRHVETNEYVACARLVRPSPNDPAAPLPFEHTCRNALDRSIIDPAKYSRDRIAEVSRLAVIAKYRRRRGEANKALPISDSSFDTQYQPRFPYILVGIYLGILAASKAHGLDVIFLLTEPRLATHLDRIKFGFKVEQVGEPVEHRGTRIPSMIKLDVVPACLSRFLRPLYDQMLAEVYQSYGVPEARSRLTTDAVARQSGL